MANTISLNQTTNTLTINGTDFSINGDGVNVRLVNGTLQGTLGSMTGTDTNLTTINTTWSTEFIDSNETVKFIGIDDVTGHRTTHSFNATGDGFNVHRDDDDIVVVTP